VTAVNRVKPRLLALLAAGAVVAIALSLVLTGRSGGGDPAAGRSHCPVEALTCSPGQFDPVESATPAPVRSDAGGDAKASGTARPSPAPSRTASTSRPSASGPSPAPRTSTGPRGTGSCASPAACGFPDASTTGPRLAYTEHKSGDLTIRDDKTVIRGWDLRGSLDVYANDVTVIDSRITSTNWWGINLRPGYHGLRVLHDTVTAIPGKGPDNGGVDYAVSNMGGSIIEVGWCDVSVFGDALSMGQGNLHDNYVHDITPFINLGGEWQHTNAVISDGGGSGELTIRHNTLLNNTPADKGPSASVGLYADVAPVTHTTVAGNWMAGGAYSFYGGSTGANHIQVTDNVFSPQYFPHSGVYGPVTAWNFDGAGNVWSGNRMSDGTPVVPQRP
jgi:hypothetical protein